MTQQKNMTPQKIMTPQKTVPWVVQLDSSLLVTVEQSLECPTTFVHLNPMPEKKLRKVKLVVLRLDQII